MYLFSVTHLYVHFKNMHFRNPHPTPHPALVKALRQSLGHAVIPLLSD